MRTVMITLILPVAILVGLACTPRFNPFWPHNMVELTEQEKALRTALPPGMELDQARAVLRSKGIQFQDEAEAEQVVVLSDGKGETITVAPGDRVVSTRLQTDASQYPCGYDIQIVLLFGQDERMKQQHIQRLRLCP